MTHTNPIHTDLYIIINISQNVHLKQPTRKQTHLNIYLTFELLMIA